MIAFTELFLGRILFATTLCDKVIYRKDCIRSRTQIEAALK